MGFGYMGLGFLLMKLSGIAFLLGIILFVVWAMRSLNKKQLKKLVQGLLIVGLLGMLLSGALFMQMDFDGKSGFGDKGQMMEMMY